MKVVCIFAINIDTTMGKKSVKQRAYLKDSLGKFVLDRDNETTTLANSIALLDTIPLRHIMNYSKVKETLSRRDAHRDELAKGIRYGKESLAFGYLVAMVFGYLFDVRERIQGLKGMSDRHFEILLNCWVVASLNSGVFKRSQLLKVKPINKKYFACIIRDLIHMGLIVELTHIEVNQLTNKIVGSHVFNHRFYRLSRECNSAIDEFNVLFGKIYKQSTANLWLNDLEKL